MKHNVQLWIAVLLTAAGVLLLFFGFWTAPLGGSRTAPTNYPATGEQVVDINTKVMK